MLLLQQAVFDKPTGDNPLQEISRAIEQKVKKAARVNLLHLQAAADFVRVARDAFFDVEGWDKVAMVEETSTEQDQHAYGFNCVH